MEPSEASQKLFSYAEKKEEERTEKVGRAIERFKSRISEKMNELEERKEQLLSSEQTQETEEELKRIAERMKKGQELLNFSYEEIVEKGFEAFPREKNNKDIDDRKLAA